MRTKISAASMTLLLITGCSGTSEDPRPAPSSSAEKGLGDIVVDGKAVTGSKPSGNKKIPYQRTYTDGALYAPITGYRSLAYGTSGLEAIYESELTEAVGDVTTTIEPAAQKAAFTALGADKGAAVVLDATNGDILAMVSTPSYDPGAFATNDPGSKAAWEKATGDEREPMLNRALREATDPGGTFGVVIAAAALEHGLYTSVDEATRGGRGRCAGATLREALTESCDDALAAVADELGPDKVGETARQLGFGEAEAAVPIRAAESTYEDGAASATPLQMARVAAALADEGRLAAPRLVREAEEPSPKVVSVYTAESLLPLLRTTLQWSPAEAADGAALSWSLTTARTTDGRTLAVAARVESDDAGLATRITDRIAEAVS
ncbi:penicillin-binding transpeptidase domain-containing protein [Streptomyces sp. NPDC050803]|uniref:penicillin-binding transpeptidase domain-containing protein n=1 Tax=unclassified Streptomyces TaxID=2593676 RepID=UPI003425449A